MQDVYEDLNFKELPAKTRNKETYPNLKRSDQRHSSFSVFIKNKAYVCL